MDNEGQNIVLLHQYFPASADKLFPVHDRYSFVSTGRLRHQFSEMRIGKECCPHGQ